MKNLIVIFGKKQSGKTTLATAIYGYYLTSKGIIPNASFDEFGKMSVQYDKTTNTGIVFDIDSKDHDMVNWYSQTVWPHICHVSFADALKETSCRLFGLDPAKVYGSNRDKETKTHIKWGDIKRLIGDNTRKRYRYKDEECITHRAFLEIFGTDICRSIDDSCHVRAAWNELVEVNPEIGIIPDGRFPNELDFIEQQAAQYPGLNVTYVFLERDMYGSKAAAEKSLDQIDKSRFNLVIANNSISMSEKNNIGINYLVENKILRKTGIQISDAMSLSTV